MATKMKGAVFWCLVVFILLLRSATPATNLIGPIQSPLPCTAFPALTGDTTTSAGSCATTDSWHKISTQTASAAASMQWTGLGSTYNEYVINCYNVYPATNSQAIYVQFGEGGTPTWKTASNTFAGTYTNSNTVTNTAYGTGSGSSSAGIDVSAGGQPNAAPGTDFSGRIHNIISTVTYASIAFRSINYTSTGPTTFNVVGSGQYIGDMTAKTAIRVIAASGNINGTCSLWALVLP